MKPRVFVSHSTAPEPTNEDERQADATLRSLAAALESAGYLVQLDRQGLKGGMAWRSVINGWIQTCEAAVLVISDRAMTSDFVAYEASVLGYRRQVDAQFRLIPLHLV